MLASGLVSEASVQYQLKHAQRAMSRYYGQNWYKLKARLDDEATGFYIREKFHALARELAGQKAEEYVSPHGEKRKAQVLEPISEKDHKGLVNDGKAGRVSYRQNFFGGCAKPGDPCPYGGISNIAMCMGYGNEKPCEHVLCKNDPVTRERVRRVQVEIQIRLVDAESDSPLADALQFAVESTQRYFDVVNAV
jgi:hypothetical protein